MGENSVEGNMVAERSFVHTPQLKLRIADVLIRLLQSACESNVVGLETLARTVRS